MHRRVLSRGVPLPIRAFAAWLTEWSFPLLGQQRSWGFISALRRFAPASGERSFLIARAHVPVRSNARPDWFSSGDPCQCEIWVRSACNRIGFWASTPVCGPCPRAMVGLADGSFLPWAFASLRVCGHRDGAFGRARPRPDRQTPRARDSRSRAPDGHARSSQPRPSSAHGFPPAVLSARRSLQRVGGLTPCPSGHLRVSPGAGSLSEVSHRP